MTATINDKYDEVIKGIKNLGTLSRYWTAQTIKMILFIEGFERHVYLDSLGYPTAGLGHKLNEVEKKKFGVGKLVDKDTLYDWAIQDLNNAMAKVLTKWPELLETRNVAIRGIFAYMVFNVGFNGWLKFKKAIKAGLVLDMNYTDAIMFLNELADSKWATQVPRALRIISHKLLLGSIDDHTFGQLETSGNKEIPVEISELIKNTKPLCSYLYPTEKKRKYIIVDVGIGE